jgi:hypothetical protein
MNSGTLFTPLDGCTTITLMISATSVIGVKSRSVS